ncbi:hypothetical protein [Paenibacillus sp. IHBB 3054]|uniref:hypothetical protein n=1 Tax=Paenibacillus sp. IHBB 3054 TaxID=3425689 RepID=UPI003F679ED9
MVGIFDGSRAAGRTDCWCDIRVQLTPEKSDEGTAAVNAVLGILVVLGIVSNPEAGKGYFNKNN